MNEEGKIVNKQNLRAFDNFLAKSIRMALIISWQPMRNKIIAWQPMRKKIIA